MQPPRDRSLEEETMFRRLAPVLLVIALLTSLAAPVALAQPPADTGSAVDPDGQPASNSTSTGDPILVTTDPSTVQTPAPVTPELGLLDLLVVTMPRLLVPLFGI
jgi:hypothetical protein